MTAAVAPHNSNMDLLRADDQMDLASSPARPTEDIDFDLDDAREISAEPNQDLMLQDEPDQPTASDLVGPVVSDLGDDDLMLDEDTVIQEEDHTDTPDLSMNNHQGEHVQINEDDDILYEDEEELQGQEGLHQASSKEQQMEDGLGVEDEQRLEEEITERLVNEFETEADTEYRLDGPLQGAEHIHGPAEQPQNSPATAALGAIDDIEAGEEASSNFLLEQQSDMRPAKEQSGGEIQQQNANEGHQEADIEGQQGKSVDLSDKAINVHEPDSHDSKALDKTLEAQALGPDSDAGPQALASLGNEELVDEPTTQSPLLHTVKINYLETEMCLFPPTEDDDSEMFFLQDVSLAYESLDKMLLECRNVLANTIGEDDELVLDIASLGLHISEGSRYATQISLWQIIDVYISLAHNDNGHSVEPLYCSLYSRVCLASRYAYLRSAANEGKTLIQTLEHTTFASGEVAEEERDYEGAQVDGQVVSPEAEFIDQSNSNDGRKGASTISEQETSLAPEDDLNGANRGDVHGPEVELSGRERDDTVGDNDGVKETEPHTKEQSPTSTVKEDSNKIEGIASSVLKADEKDQSTEDMIGDFAKSGGYPNLSKSNSVADPNDAGRLDIENDIQESVSSKTLEAENNQLEEDLFSQDDNPSFNNGNDNPTGVQRDRAEDFELKEQNHRGTSGERDIEVGTKSDHLHECDDDDREYAVPSSTPDLSNESGAHHDDYKNNQRPTHAEGDDELLEFDDHGEAEAVTQERNEETSLSRSQITVLGDENIHGDVTRAYDNESTTSGRTLSSGLLENYRNGSPGRRSIGANSTNLAREAPTTPSGSKNGFKRKTLDDEDEIDLLDAATPDKKRGRPA